MADDPRYDLFIPNKYPSADYGANWRELEMWSKRFRTALTDSLTALIPVVGGQPTSISPDDTLSAGSDPRAARTDHRHAITANAPLVSLVISAAGTPPAEGSSNTFARSDHFHPLYAGNVAALVPAAASAEGSATSPARYDHQHGVPVAAPPGGTAGVAASLARSDHHHTTTEAQYIRARATSTQALAWATETVVSFTGSSQGSGTALSPTYDSATSEVVINQDGVYLLMCEVKFTFSNTNATTDEAYATVHIWRNRTGASPFLISDPHSPKTPVPTSTNIENISVIASTVYRLFATDRIGVTALYSCGGAAAGHSCNLFAASDYTPVLSVARMENFSG